MAHHPTLTQSYYARASLPNTSPLTVYLLRLIAIKKTNLCVSADLTTSSELLELAEELGDSICVFKTHADIVSDFGGRTMDRLQEIARRKHFLIFEDRKFGDIGNTVQKQYTAGPLTIVRWAHIINCHVFPGPAIITALASAAANSIATFNSKVTTSISASPSQSYLDSSDEVPSPSFSASRIDEVDEEDYVDIDGSKPSSDDEEEVEEEEQQREDPGRLRHGSATSISSNADRSGRKPSVVSVSTTISTKTETLSPQPAPARDPSNPNSSDSDSDDTSADREKHLQRLGEPPMARALLLLAEMSSAGNLLTGEYTSKCVDMARQQADFVMGFIAQRSLNSQPNDNFVTMTPGVQIGKSGDDKGQQYNTPEKVVKEAGADIIIVGRGITEASDRAAAAETYRQRGWKAYEDRVRGN